MSLSVYLWGIRLFTIFSFCAFLSVVIALDPQETGDVSRGLFFISAFALLLGILTLTVTWMYRMAFGDARTAHCLSGAFRQALLLSLYILGILFFQYVNILTWWDALLFFAFILLVEFSIRHYLFHS